MKISLLDNHNGHNFGQETGVIAENVYDVLRGYSGKTLGELRSKSEGGLVEFGLDEGASSELSLYEAIEIDESDPGNRCLRLDTGNLMGVVRLKRKGDLESVQLEIRSRFDGSKSGQPFLSYLLSRVFNVDYTDLVSASDGTALMQILTAIQFVRKLGAVEQLGLYRRYVEFRRNDLNMRGRIDLQRQIRENIPVGVGVAYVTREMTYDTPLNHLLRFAIEVINRKWPRLLSSSRSAHGMSIALKMNTPTWDPNSKMRILANRECIEELRHPYYGEYYEVLRVLARKVVLENGLDVYADSEDEVSGVIFNGAWLWEEYLATILDDVGFVHSNCADIGRIDGFRNLNGQYGQRMYPDFYSKSRSVVLDAKYKRKPNYEDCKNGYQRSDILQLFAYVLLTNAKVAGLIYPPLEGNGTQQESSAMINQSMTNDDVEWKTFAFGALPENVDIESFMSEQEMCLKRCFEIA